MKQLELIKVIDGLLIDLGNKKLEYAECPKRNDDPAVKMRVKLELKSIETHIGELKQELVMVMATTPTN